MRGKVDVEDPGLEPESRGNTSTTDERPSLDTGSHSYKIKAVIGKPKIES